MNKKQARVIAKHKRMQITKADHIIKSKIITQKIESHHKFINAKIVGIYAPMKTEVNIDFLNLDNKKVVYPRVNKKKALEYVLVDDKTKWEINKFGVKEPKNGKIINEETIDLLIIPALARNNSNYRLGYGAGHYDRYLKDNYPLYTIGVIFDNYTVDFIEDFWDIKLDEFISN